MKLASIIQGSLFSMTLRKAGLVATKLSMIGTSSKNYPPVPSEDTLTLKKKLKAFISPILSKTPLKL